MAREAASLVLLDDNFGSLVTAVRLGRRIDDNLRKAIGYILAVHVPIAGMSLIPVLLGWPLLLSPVHVVFLELIIDPMSSIAFEAEPEEIDVMARPPRDPKAPLFGPALLARGFAQGAVVFVATLAMFLYGVRVVQSEEAARAMAFVTLVLGNLGLVLTNRSLTGGAFSSLLRPNPALGAVAAATLLALALTFSVQWVRDLFGFASLAALQMAGTILAACVSLLANDLIGAAFRQVRRSGRAR